MTSTTWKNQTLNKLFRYSETTYYVGLSSRAPGSDGWGSSEPIASYGYRRMPINRWTNPSGGVISNADTITFPKSTGVWFSSLPAAYWVLFTGSSSAAVCWGSLEEPLAVLNHTTVTLPANSIRISLSDSAGS